MLALKIICDNTYSNKSWCIIGQGMFALQEISQMEQEMCSCLEFAYALHCMWLHSSMTFVMLYLLQHLKSCFPA